MKEQNQHLKRYCRKVKGWLPCYGKRKKNMIRRISATICAWLEENPTADYAAIERRFGTPQQIAAAYVDEMETRELLQHLRIRRKVVAITAACAAFVMAVWLGFATIALVDALKGNDSYIEEGPIVEQEVIVGQGD